MANIFIQQITISNLLNFNDQIISIYYYAYPVNPNDLAILPTKTKHFDFTTEQTANPQGQAEVLRWVEWNDLSEATVHLPIDKIVVKLLKQ